MITHEICQVNYYITYMSERAPLVAELVKNPPGNAGATKDASLILGYGRSPGVQFSSVIQSCQTLCDPMNRSTPGLPVHHQLPEFTQTQVH